MPHLLDPGTHCKRNSDMFIKFICYETSHNLIFNTRILCIIYYLLLDYLTPYQCFVPRKLLSIMISCISFMRLDLKDWFMWLVASLYSSYVIKTHVGHPDTGMKKVMRVWTARMMRCTTHCGRSCSMSLKAMPMSVCERKYLIQEVMEIFKHAYTS